MKLRLYKLTDFYADEASDDLDIERFRIDRNYRYVDFSFGRKLKPVQYNDILAQLMTTANNIRSVNFEGCELSRTNFLSFLQQCNRLEDLSIKSCDIRRSYEVHDQIQLHLNSFCFVESDKWILDDLSCKKVSENLTFKLSDSQITQSVVDEIVRFLNAIDGEIGALEFREVDLDKTSVELDPKFKWKSLDLTSESVDTMFSGTMINKEKLYTAASPNATTLQFCFDNGHQRLYRLIACNTVNKLVINQELFAKTQPSYETLPNRNTITHLTITPVDKPSQDLMLSPPSPLCWPFLNKFNRLKSLKMCSTAFLHFSSEEEEDQRFHLHISSLDLSIPHGYLARTSIDIGHLTHIKIVIDGILMITGAAQDLLHVNFAEFLSSVNRISPSLRKIRIKLFPLHQVMTEEDMHRILLNTYAATSSVVLVFEIEWSFPRRLLRITRETIMAQFYGNDDAIRSTFALMQGREFRR